MLERSAGYGLQQVDRDGLDVEIAECEGKFDPLFHSFTHADDASAAEVHPTRRAACKVFSFCSCVCVVQSESKWEGAVSRLQWYRVTPASYNACNSSSSNSPSEAHNRIDEWRRIRRAATQSSFMFLGEGLRPLVTNEKRLTPCASLYLLVAGTLLRSPDRIHRPWSCSETTGRTIYNFPTPS